MIGIAGVVAVLVGVLSIAGGLPQDHGGLRRRPTRPSCCAAAPTAKWSAVSAATTLVSSPTRRAWPDGRGPLASPELFVIINLPKRSTGTDANVPLRGRRKRSLRGARPFQNRAGPPLRTGQKRSHRRRSARPGSSPAWKWATRSRWAASNGRWLACFPPVAARLNRRFGPTRRCCRGPFTGATVFSPCTPS